MSRCWESKPELPACSASPLRHLQPRCSFLCPLHLPQPPVLTQYLPCTSHSAEPFLVPLPPRLANGILHPGIIGYLFPGHELCVPPASMEASKTGPPTDYPVSTRPGHSKYFPSWMTVLIHAALGKGLKSSRGKGVFKFGAKVIASLSSLPRLLRPCADFLSPGWKKATGVASLHSSSMQSWDFSHGSHVVNLLWGHRNLLDESSGDSGELGLLYRDFKSN